MHSEKVDPNKTPESVEECKPQDKEDRSCKLNDLSQARGEYTEGESDGVLTLVSPCLKHQPGGDDAFIEVSENDETSPKRTVVLSDTSHIATPGAVTQRRQAARLAFPKRYHQETDSAHLSKLYDLLSTSDARDHTTFQKILRLVRHRPKLLRVLVDRARNPSVDEKLYTRITSVLAGVGHDTAQDALLSLVQNATLMQWQRRAISNCIRAGSSLSGDSAYGEALALDQYPKSREALRPSLWVAPDHWASWYRALHVSGRPSSARSEAA